MSDNLPFFSQHPEDVARRYRAFLQAIELLQQELVRLHGIFPPSYVWYIPAYGAAENLSPPWEDGLPPAIREHVVNVRAEIQRTAEKYGFPSPLAQKTSTADNPG